MCSGSAIPAEQLVDRNLRKLISVFEIKPQRAISEMRLDPKARLGQALFFDPIVSGTRGVSCAACHVRSKGAGDGLSVAVGIGARGVGNKRTESPAAFLVPRNALPFFNRADEDFRAYFWDGRIQLSVDGSFESPLGSNLPNGFENLLAVATVFPPTEPDEMLGRSEEIYENKHQSFRELLDGLKGGTDNYQERTLKVFDNLIKRIVGNPSVTPSAVQSKYRSLFAQAFPATSVDHAQISHVGNALAAYIKVAFSLRPAPWDLYVSGDSEAISAQQKRGALVFMGKGRCIVCHNGTQYSDFAFHGLAVPQLSPGKHGAFLDYGRASATSLPSDRFQFRTPPLRNVSRTGPWGHNGVFNSVREVVEHHFNPVPSLYKAQQSYAEAARHSGRLLASRSPLLGDIAPLTEADLADLVSFLEALSSDTAMSNELALPKDVPSGDMQFVVP
jgi:cytochrome c peroxidase